MLTFRFYRVNVRPMPNLPEQLDAAAFHSLSLCRSGDEWQASLEVERNSFRIRTASTPSLAIAVLFEPAPTLPPLPY